MVLNVHRNHKAYQGRGAGGGVWRWGKREITYPLLHCRHQNDSCIKMGSEESHFNVSLIVWHKVTRQRPQTTTQIMPGVSFMAVHTAYASTKKKKFFFFFFFYNRVGTPFLFYPGRTLRVFTCLLRRYVAFSLVNRPI